MKASPGHPLLRLLRFSDIGISLVVVGIIFMLIVPLPPELLDLLLVVNISGSVLTIMISIYINEPVEFAVFPTLLLVATLYRLALDVSATRMILLHGNVSDPVSHTPTGAGHLIPAFGSIVVGGNLVVGFILFAILIVIQLLVITNGAERIAQVAARFTLDKLPGEQMAIDADLHAGLIDADGARARRRKLQKETDFFGAMDGAGRFVKGDAMAAVVIMVVNVVGGILVGICYHQMSAGEAVNTYSLLSIGNGLLTTLPSFLMSTSMGMVVSRAAASANLGEQVADELTAHPTALKLTASLMGVLGVLGMAGLLAFPPLPFFLMGGLMFFVGHALTREQVQAEEVQVQQAEQVKKEAVRKPDTAIGLLPVDPLSLEVGRGLISLVDPEQGAKLLERVTSIRRHIVLELGIILPGVRFRDNLQLKPNAYVIKVRDMQVATGEVHIHQFLAIGPQERLRNLRGTKTTDPTYGMPGVWLSPEQRGDAERLGCMIFDPVSVIATQLTEVVRSHAEELLGRQEVQALLDSVKKTHPAVVKEVVPDALALGDVQRVLQNLVRERVSIRDLVIILETLADNLRITRDPELLTELVRVRLSRAICREYANNEEVINVVTLDPAIEQAVLQATARTEAGTFLTLEPALGQEILQALSLKVAELQEQGLQPILLCAPTVRASMRKLSERSFPNLVVLSWNEVATRVRVNSLGMVSL